MKICITNQLNLHQKTQHLSNLGGFWPNRKIVVNLNRKSISEQFVIIKEIEEWCSETFNGNYSYNFCSYAECYDIIIYLELEEDLMLFKLRWV